MGFACARPILQFHTIDLREPDDMSTPLMSAPASSVDATVDASEDADEHVREAAGEKTAPRGAPAGC
jgi:hypothetical protein